MDDSGAMSIMFFVILSLTICFLCGISPVDGVFFRGAASIVMLPFYFFYNLSTLFPWPLAALAYFVGFRMLTFPALGRLLGEETVGLSVVAMVALMAMTHSINIL